MRSRAKRSSTNHAELTRRLRPSPSTGRVGERSEPGWGEGVDVSPHPCPSPQGGGVSGRRTFEALHVVRSRGSIRVWATSTRRFTTMKIVPAQTVKPITAL